MPYSLYDPTIEVVKPKFWIARPNKRIVTRVKELDELASFHATLGGINEISGEIPYLLNRNGKTINNPHIKYVKNKYLIKMQFMDNTEWFVIEDVNKNGNEEKDTISFTAYNLAYNLRGKKLYNDKFDGKTPKEVMDELLSGTSWATGRISTIIGGKIRSFDEFSPNTNTIEAINTISESYAGIPSYDSNDKLINLLHKDDYAIVSNLMLNDKNYIQSYQKDSNTDEIVTRLFATGEDGLNIAGISPTGKMYIDKFDWYMYPFKRDVNKNVLSSSDYMSDELCHAILDQQEAIVAIEPLVKAKRDLIDQLTDSLTALENTEDEMRLKYETTEGILDFMRANEEYYYSEFLTSGSSYSFTFRQGYFIGQARAKNGSTSAQLSFGGTVRNLTNEWSTFKYDMSSLDPLGDGQSMNVASLTADNCEFYIVRVPVEEYNTYTDTQVKEKYNGIYWKEQYDSAKNTYTARQNEINALQTELTALYETVGDDHFYTLELLREKDEFIHVYYWEETTHTVAQELYDDAVEKLNELHKPKLTIETDIFNFLASLDDKRNWKKLILGSRVRVKHSRLDEYNEVILTGIEYDFANETIKLTLEDIKDLKADEFTQMVMQGANASSTLNLNKKLWDDNVVKSQTFDQILNSEYDATKRRILAGVNESVTFDGRGLRIINPDYPNEMLVGTAGVIGISTDGGQTFPTAISGKGVHADKLIGKMIIGQKLLIRNDEGTVSIDGATLSVKDRSDVLKVQLGEYEANKFGLQVYDGAINIRTKGTTGNTGLILDKDGLRSYNNSGKEMFNLNSNTGSATFSGNLNGANGTFSGNLSAVGGTFTGTLQGVDGTFTGTLNGNSIIGASITGGTITGTKFMTYDTSNEGQITISGSTFKSTNYSDDNHYVEISNGGLLIHTYSDATATYQTVDISGNYGIRIFSDIYPNSSLRMDVYETNSSKGTQVYKIHASGTYADLLVLSDNELRIKGNSINLEPTTYEGAMLKGKPIAVKDDIYTALNGYWYKGSDTGYLSSSVYIGGASIGVGGSFDGSASTSNVSIGSSNIYVPGKVYAGGSALTSDRDKKKNINPYEKEALPEILSTQIYTYNLKTELDGEFPHLGIILQEAPIDVVDPSGGVELYAMTSFAWKAIQELYDGLQGVSCQLNN